MPVSKWKTEFTALTMLIAAVVFVTDLTTPPPVAISLLYVALVLLTLFHPQKSISFMVAVSVTLFSLVALMLVPAGEIDAIVITNQIIAISGIWVAFLFILRYKTREQAGAKYRERLDALFTYATEGILIANAKGEIVMVNPMAGKQLHYDPSELIGKKIEVLIPDRLSKKHVGHREKFIADPHPRPMGQGMQLFAKRKDGSEFPVEISLSNFKTQEGTFVIAFIIDITQRRIIEELIRHEKELAQQYLDIAPVLFVVINQHGEVTLINQNGCQILGLTEPEIIGKNWFDIFIPEEIRESVRSEFNSMISGSKPLVPNFENEIVSSAGERKTISWKNIFIRDDHGNPVSVLSAGEDVTERKRQEEVIAKTSTELRNYTEEIAKLNAHLEKRVKDRTTELAETVHKLESANSILAIEIKERKTAEENLKASREELRQALSKEKELSELKSRFVTMASHEFRTPLSTILSSASLAGKYNDPEEVPKRIKHLNRIKSSVNNLTSILNDFLSLGKLEEGMVNSSPSKFNIIELGNDLIAEMREVTMNGQIIHFTHKGDTEIVFLDKNLTRNICINLLSNAIKYSPENKSIDFTVTTLPDKVILRIADQGIGIPKGEQQHIFDRFFRANNATNIQGTGLGLNIVKKYTELMDGTIRFESDGTNGTTFIVELPLRAPD
ncbi:MAG TPA: PAS domain S-box protein [Bacteroidia bacterium]|nr:PAS domain S-box protein [Bacteroidia bacterium]